MFEFKGTPFKHQQEAFVRSQGLDHYALLFEMGAGKTPTAIMLALGRYIEAKRILPTVIFAPPVVVGNWVAEWAKFTNIPKNKIVPLLGSGLQRAKILNDAIAKGGDFIFVTNYESLLMKDLFAALQSLKPGVVIFDESHKCKSTKAQRSKRAFELANPRAGKKPFTYILSGSPILNSPMDIFQQYKILDGGRTFGSNEFAFRARYFRDRNAGMPKDRYFPKWEIMSLGRDGIDALSEINQRLFSCGMRVEKKDCLDLPPEVDVTIKVGMTKEQARLYKEMKTDFITFFNSRACTATLAITKALRLMQLTSGFVSTDGREDGLDQIVTTLPCTPKAAALEELLEDICQDPKAKVIVWSVWKHNYAQIAEVCKKLGLDYVEVHGQVSATKKTENIERFQNDPNCRVYIGHPDSGGIGVNLTVAGFDITYSSNFKLEAYLQKRARNHRSGSKEAGHEKITHYDLVCEGTIDELVLEKLAGKIAISDKILMELI